MIIIMRTGIRISSRHYLSPLDTQFGHSMDLKDKVVGRSTRSIPTSTRHRRHRSQDRHTYSSSDNEGDINTYEYIENRIKPFTLDKGRLTEGKSAPIVYPSGQVNPVGSGNHRPEKASHHFHQPPATQQPAHLYSFLSGSEGETPAEQQQQQQQRSRGSTLRTPQPLPPLTSVAQPPRHAAGLSDTPSSTSTDNNSDATYTDSELALARDSTLLVHQGTGGYHGYKLRGFVDNPVDTYPPDVPPRNTSMGRANTRGNGHNQSGAPQEGVPDRDDFEPSCLVRTPSGSVFIPTDIPKNSSQKSNTESNSPIKSDTLKTNPDRCQLPYPNTVSVPVRNNLRRPNSNHFSHSRFQIRKSFSSRCSWKCTAIVFIFLTLLLSAAIAYFAAMSMLKWQYEAGRACAVMVEDTELVIPATEVNRPTIAPAKTLPPDGNTFMEIKLNKRISNEISPYGHWNTQFHQPHTAFVRFNYTIAKEAKIGVYGRRNAFPTHTQYDFMEILCNDENRNKRATKDTINIGFVQYLESGQWYISIYNDDGQIREINFLVGIAEDMSLTCPYDCHGHGVCNKGHCECQQGFTGTECADSVCPVLCSGNGEYVNGQCQCKPGWKGKECNLRHDECEVPGCSGHGHCIEGKCRCVKGYKGEFCEQVDCLIPDCSGHGVCVEGFCICRKGWRGDDCGLVDDDMRRCLPDCSGHGRYDLEKQQCVCEAKWTGHDCSKEMCDLNCGAHGKCEGGHCHCQDGWTGPKCDVKTCDPRCLEHGQCKNGTCICIQGWNGKHCTLDGCPHNCRNHGVCEQDTSTGDWYCRCQAVWDGTDCSIPLEINCDDTKDNDNDGLIDCADSECCSSKVCSDSLMCVSTSDPLDVLLRKQPPAVTASFFQRMRFLIEEDSLQNYARKTAFNESRASVIRGRVISPSGSGLIGIRVSTTNAQEGFTLTRDTGWFDLMVNGGGAVTLQFQRNPFRLHKHTVMVPWNEVIVIDNVVMSMQEESDFDPPPDPCPEHNYDLMKPVVLATWKHQFQGGCPDKSTILAESQVVQESLPIPGSNLHLVYHSSRAGGYMSTLQLQLTPETIPKALRLIHLRISIEGSLFEKVFEADPNIKYTYAWNRRNVYRQRVYGVTTATVSVGYEYSTCHDIIWDVQTTKLSGHDMSISEIGNWNLDIHHRYNFHEGILQKGDGTNIYLRYKPKVLLTTMGNGEQRNLECPFCNGLASEQRLLAPVALAAAPDGSLYVGDFNLVRRILPDRTVMTVVELNPSKVSYRYHLTVNPIDGTVFISDPERHQILRVKSIEDITDPKTNYVVAIGNGERCLPGDKNNCGDGGPATEAKLVYPKGIVVSADNNLYFADGTTIRTVNKKGIIRTLIGDHRHKSHWKPIPCQGTLSLNEVHLRWPTELSINPLDGSLHIIDDHMVLRLTQDGRIKVVAGQPLHCPTQPTSGRDDMDLAIHSTLVFPESIAFAPNGDLYIAESDSQRINRVRVIGTDGKITNFAGVETKCNCLERDCRCFDDDHFLAATSKLNTISSIAVTPDGIVHISDQGNLRVRSVISSLPEHNKNREYEIYSPETQEVYIFNRFGQHTSTRNILTGKLMYIFTYNVNTSYGRLSTVTDAAGNKIYILRDYSNQVNSIENTQGQKCRLSMTRMRMLQDFITPDFFKTTFDYHGNTGLLKSKKDSSGQSYYYMYDEDGRLTEAVTPTGEVIKLTFDLSVKGATVKIARDQENPLSMVIKGMSVTTRIGNADERTSIQPDGSVSTYMPWGQGVITETVAYPVLEDIDPVLGESFPVPARQKTMIHDDQVHRLEWRYLLKKEGKGKNKQVTVVQKRMRVNGDNLLTVEFDRDTSTEVLYDHQQLPLLTVRYDQLGRPLQWLPSANVTHVDLKYDRFGRLSQWQRGDLSEQYGFDRQGRLAEIRYADGAMIVYTFADIASGLPTEIMVPSGHKYQLQYDESNSLQAVTTPRGVRHEFGIQTSLGFYKLFYIAPGSHHQYVITFNDRGQILTKMYPEMWGRVTYMYDEDDRLSTVLYGECKSEHNYYSDSGLIKSITHGSSEFDSRLDYKYHGGLLREEKIRYGSKLGLESAKIKYQYDGNAYLQRVEMELNGKELPAVNFSYNANTGLLDGALHLQVIHYWVNETLIQDKSGKQLFTRLRVMDPYNRDIAMVMTIRNKEVFRLEVTHDSRNRVRNSKTKIGDKNNPVVRSYSYNIDGYLEEVIGPETWKYSYDENGNVALIKQGTHEVRVVYNETDKMVTFGEQRLLFDARGFVIQRGDDKYHYNAKAQVTSAAQKALYDVRFYYDAYDRLVAILDHSGNLTQYFYTHPRQPKLITVVHSPKSGNTLQLIYDERDHLLYFQQGETKYYVATDYTGSPVAVFNQNGDLIKEVQRSPFGRILKDTNPALFLPVDFHGGLREPVSGLIHFGTRVYDPLLGQWLTSDWENILHYLPKPYDMYLYRFNRNDPVNPITLTVKIQYLTELVNWLPLFGYSQQNLLGVPLPPYHEARTSIFPPSLSIISGLNCATEMVQAEFRRLNFMPKTRVKVENNFAQFQPRVSHRKEVFGEGLLMSRVQGRAIVHNLEGSVQVLQDVVVSVLNNSHFLDLLFTGHGQDVFHFVKEGFAKFSDDRNQLNRIAAMFNITQHESQHGNDIKLHSHSAVINVRYGTTVEQERHRLLKHARKRAVEVAWEQERELLRTGQKGRNDWSETEAEQLLASGVVTGYYGEDIFDINKYTSLANDPTNVVFKKDTNRHRRKGKRNPK